MTHQIPRHSNQQNTGILNQQFCLAGTDHLLAVSLSLAGRAVLQMDQATPAHQIIFRHLRECRQDTNLDSRIRVCSGRHHKKTTQHQEQSLHNSTVFEYHCFEQMPLNQLFSDHDDTMHNSRSPNQLFLFD